MLGASPSSSFSPSPSERAPRLAGGHVRFFSARRVVRDGLARRAAALGGAAAATTRARRRRATEDDDASDLRRQFRGGRVIDLGRRPHRPHRRAHRARERRRQRVAAPPGRDHRRRDPRRRQRAHAPKRRAPSLALATHPSQEATESGDARADASREVARAARGAGDARRARAVRERRAVRAARRRGGGAVLGRRLLPRSRG